MTWVMVLLGGAVGAVARFGVNWLAERNSRPSPWATFTVNVVGSLVLGLLAGVGTALPGWVGTLVGTGFCGALTTYSTFGYETVRLAGAGPAGRGWALLNVVATLTVGLGVAALGWQLGSRL
ncbi:fluoride efflux transporter FluC [Plantactinospora solaniradicis]|uniref:Fluoride-specific ion channel FluC n=1 Tax=Plantactinospora solaniradicis TaxID=1723736 RepID=A0ABW1KCR5_9ACTN